MTAGERDDRTLAPTLDEAARAIVRASARLHARGLLAGTEGNLSVRLADGTLLATPSGADKARLAPEDLIRLNPDGSSHHDVTDADEVCNIQQELRVHRASSEIRMHLRAYARRPEIMAVVHAHPPAATAFATAGRALPADVLPELIVNVGPIALVPYARPGTDALPDAMTPWLDTHHVFLLANHGVTALGTSIESAMHRLESCEQAARILLGAALLGGAQSLPPGEADALRPSVSSSVVVHSESTA
jgi:L-fuculose-phosphate aldolase